MIHVAKRALEYAYCMDADGFFVSNLLLHHAWCVMYDFSGLYPTIALVQVDHNMNVQSNEKRNVDLTRMNGWFT